MWFKVRGSLRDQLGVRKGVEKASKNEPLLTEGETFFTNCGLRIHFSS